MPITASNDGSVWDGILIDGFAGYGHVILKNFQSVFEKMSLPKASIKSTKTNMWHRSDTPCLDIVSTLDGAYTCTILAVDYGPDLWVGWVRLIRDENNYKAMASFCLTLKIKEIVIKAINSTATGLNRNVSYTGTK